LGFIARKLKKNKAIEVIFDLHFVIQKEGSALDKRFTKMGIRQSDAYVVHAYKTARELKALFPEKKFEVLERGQKYSGSGIRVMKLYHPVYDMFQPDPDFDVQKAKNEMGLKKHVFLFFGFIRKYKGLHNVIRAFAQLAEERDDVSLLIVGESFWNTLDNNKLSTRIKNATFGVAKKIFLKKQDDERNYHPLALIDELNLREKTYVMNDFVPNEMVHKYFQVSDYIMLFYLTATPSGIESIAYNFRMPMLATRVGHFSETIQDGYNGYLAEPENIDSMTGVMRKAIEHPIPRENVAETAKDMSWENYAAEILR